MNEETEEVYLGGITQTDFIVMGFPGNGIHVTNRRLILIRSRVNYGFGLFGAISSIGGDRSGRLSGNAARKKIRGLEKKMYFNAYKEDLSGLELKAPDRTGTSQLRIVPKLAESIEVSLNSSRDYEVVKALMILYHPDIVKIT